MKIIMLSDIHIPNINTFNINYNFEISRLLNLTKEINSLNPDKVFILGDLLDKPKPTITTISLLTTFITNINGDIYYLNGNHERFDNNVYSLDLLLPYIGAKKLDTNFTVEEVSITAYGHDGLIKLINDYNKADLLLSHFRWTHDLYGKGELQKKIENRLINQYKNIILGDIHYFYKPENNVYYCNQPYTNTYQPLGDRGFLIVTIKGKDIRIEKHLTNLPNKVKYNLPFSKLAKTLDSIKDSNNLYKLLVSMTDTEYNIYKKFKLPNNVIVVPNIIKNENKSEAPAISIIPESINDVLFNLLDKNEVEYIKGLLV